MPDLIAGVVLALDMATPWQPSGPALGRWTAYLNRLSLAALVPWLREDYGLPVAVWPTVAALPSFWELVNGTALQVGTTRWVVIPQELIEPDELRVPQEWVDLWTADYYVAVQMQVDDGQARVWGWATHHQLKAQGQFDPLDRTYTLDEAGVSTDLGCLWAQVTAAVVPARATVPALGSLPLAQAQQLLARLGRAEVLMPRLEIPFALWAALLTHAGWRQRLYELRQGLPEAWSLPRWLHDGVPELAQTLGWALEQGSLGQARSQSQTNTLARSLVVDDLACELRISPIQGGVWRFKLRAVAWGVLLPAGFELRLLTEDLQHFPKNKTSASTAVEELLLDVRLEPGEGLVWEVVPEPTGYEREILRF